MSRDPMLQLCDQIRETAFAVHGYFGPGHFEKVYENALVNRLSKAGVKIMQQASISVHDEDGTVVGEYVADLVINDELIIELKACDHLNDAHRCQIMGYLRATKMRHGLLINFGTHKFEIKKYIL